MNHSQNRRSQPHSFHELSVGCNAIITDIRCSIALGFVSEAEHLPCARVEFRVRGECQTGQLSIEVVQAGCLKGMKIQRIWRGVFLQGQQFAVKVNNVCVGCGTDLKFHSIGKFVAVFAYRINGFIGSL